MGTQNCYVASLKTEIAKCLMRNNNVKAEIVIKDDLESLQELLPIQFFSKLENISGRLN